MNNLRIVGKTEFVTELSFGVSLNNKELHSILNKAIHKITPKQSQQIKDKWLIEKYQEKIDHTALYQFVTVFLFVGVMVSLYIQKILKLKRAIL